jgi:hypothetical protein
MSSSGGGCIIYLIAGFFGGLWLAYSGTKQFLLLQKIENTPTSKVDAAAVGLVELYGKAICDGDMRSPISDARCAHWRIRAEYYRSGKHGGWREIFKRDSSSRFRVEDETGRMLVDPKGATVEIPVDNRYQGYISGKGVFGMPHQQMDGRVIKFIDSLDAAGKKAFMNHAKVDVRIFENYIAEEDLVYVLGDAQPLEGATSAKAHENLIIRKKDVMYISDSAEKKVVESMRGGMLWAVFGGIGLSIACAAIIILVFWAF